MEEHTDSTKVPVVKAVQILEAAGLKKKSTVRLGTWEQETGLKLAWAVGTVAAIVIFIALAEWWWCTPATPKLTASLTPQQAGLLIKDYDVLANDALSRSLHILDAFLVRPLLPIFTTIVGYVIGHRVHKQ